MENVNVYSPIEDKKIKTDFQNSPIWKKAYTDEEYYEDPKRYPYWFKYSFKFEGLIPKQVTKVQKLAI
jgi:hypothetical protein